MSLRDEANHEQELDALRGALRRAQAQLAKATTGNRMLVAAVYRAAKDSAITYVPAKPPAKSTSKAGAEVALVHATDWQIGKRTESYNVEIAQERIERLARKVVGITDIQRKDHPVDECVLMLGGDMVEGTTIFPGQAWELDSTLFGQLFAATASIELLVRTFAQNFAKVRVVCEYGNHGRIGKYGEGPKGDNVDRMAYQIAKDRTANLSNVTWQMSEAWHQTFIIGAYKVLLVHGDEIRTYSGTPLFGIIKRVSSWAAGIVPEFHDCYMGHWHNPASITIGNGNRVFITGSPESGNIYAAEHLAAQAKPSQRLHFIDPKAGRVASEYVLWLD
jgi:hypothetical protein